jgi:tRNA(Ile2) C34 agmatinyltransferase TiaS
MSDDDMYWFNSYLFRQTMTFSERLDWYDDHIILDQKYKGSGFTDISFKSIDYYLVFASFGYGKLEYEVIYYSHYFDFQSVINIFTIIIVAIGIVYLFIQLENLATEKKLKETKLKTKSTDNVVLKRIVVITAPRSCERCGSSLDSDSRYCHECGKIITIRQISDWGST